MAVKIKTVPKIAERIERTWNVTTWRKIKQTQVLSFLTAVKFEKCLRLIVSIYTLSRHGPTIFDFRLLMELEDIGWIGS